MRRVCHGDSCSLVLLLKLALDRERSSQMLSLGRNGLYRYLRSCVRPEDTVRVRRGERRRVRDLDPCRDLGPRSSELA